MGAENQRPTGSVPSEGSRRRNATHRLRRGGAAKNGGRGGHAQGGWRRGGTADYAKKGGAEEDEEDGGRSRADRRTAKARAAPEGNGRLINVPEQERKTVRFYDGGENTSKV